VHTPVRVGARLGCQESTTVRTKLSGLQLSVVPSRNVGRNRLRRFQKPRVVMRCFPHHRRSPSSGRAGALGQAPPNPPTPPPAPPAPPKVAPAQRLGQSAWQGIRRLGGGEHISRTGLPRLAVGADANDQYPAVPRPGQNGQRPQRRETRQNTRRHRSPSSLADRTAAPGSVSPARIVVGPSRGVQPRSSPASRSDAVRR